MKHHAKNSFSAWRTEAAGTFQTGSRSLELGHGRQNELGDFYDTHDKRADRKISREEYYGKAACHFSRARGGNRAGIRFDSSHFVVER
jgi:hypothetical protein